MTTSTPPVELITLSSVSAFAGTLTNLLVYVGAGIVVFRAAVHANLASCLAVLLLSLALALAIGLAAATFQIAFQKGSALIWLLGSGLWFLSGTMFPINNLPRPLEVLARLVPFTYAINGFRGALLEGQPLVAHIDAHLLEREEG